MKTQTPKTARPFPEAIAAETAAEREGRVRARWEERRIFEKSVSERDGAPRFVFYEGPPTANGKPGVHHVFARTMKDVVCRYWTMKGRQVERKGGWDTHGLPVEIEVEKALGISGKGDIEKLGVKEFNRRCRESVFRYRSLWEDMSRRMGYWLDLSDPYVTCTNDYIESVWSILRKLWDDGLLYRGHKVLPYCPRCGTALSSHETSLGYKDVTEPSVYVKFRLFGKPDHAVLAWTTTPWTLPGNVALAVGADVRYVKVRVPNGGPERPDAPAEHLYLAKDALDRVLEPGYEVEEELTGKDMEGWAYEPLYRFLPADPDADPRPAWYVATADFATADDGTGVVHTAVMYGEDDYRLGVRLGLPRHHTVDASGRFTPEVTPWAGVFVKDADPAIRKDLRQRNLLYRTANHEHSYPFCWRCDSPLLYYARDSWFVATTKMRDDLLREAKRASWHPPEIGDNRFLRWLEGNVDWALSRDRYWGTPLPLWICEGCGETTCVGSVEELASLAGPLPEPLDLHKPDIDEVGWACACGGRVRRSPEVIDAWFDSGAMPFAQWHWPFENAERFEASFPADYISEGIDQTRGWFYSLLVIATAMKGVGPYKNVLPLELILDDAGRKMSKRLGNVVDPWDVLDREGADALRWYLCVMSPPWLPKRFSRDGLQEADRKAPATLANVRSFFTTYANVEGFDPESSSAGGVPAPAPADRPELDRWLLSRLHGLVADVDRSLAEYQITRAARLLQDFVMEDLSNWYVRRSRRRFWKGGASPDAVSGFATLHEALHTTARLLAPLVPFGAEELYLAMAEGRAGAEESVHLARFPEADEGLRDLALEESMDAARRVVGLVLAARNRHKVKVRQPLATVAIATGARERAALERLADVVMEEVNVKRLDFSDEAADRLAFVLKLRFDVAGKKYGKKVQGIAKALGAAPPAAARDLRAGRTVDVEAGGETFTLSPDEVEVRVVEPEGVAIEADQGIAVLVDLALDDDLRREGLARECVNRLQSMRRDAGFQVTDRVTVTWAAEGEVARALREHAHRLADEVLAVGFREAAAGEAPAGDAVREWSVGEEKVTFGVAVARGERG